MRLAVVLALIALALGAGPRVDPGHPDREPSEIAKARLAPATHPGTTHRRLDGSSHGPLALADAPAPIVPVWTAAPAPTAASVGRGHAAPPRLRSRSPPSGPSLLHPRPT
jgi:hypothetical protein